VSRLQVGWIDVAIALGLSVASLAMGSGSDGIAYNPAVLLCTAPLVVRRRWPIPVLALALLGFLLAGNASNLAALIGGLVAAVSVGLDSRHPIAGVAAVAVVGIAIAVEFGRGSTTELPIPGWLSPILIIGSAFLAGRAVASQRERADEIQKQQYEAVKAAAEGARRHMARELHDVIAHSVAVMVVQAGAARHILAEKPDAARASLEAVEASGHEAMAELRRLLGVLGENGEAPREPEPGLAQLEGLVERVRHAGLPVRLGVEGERLPLPPGADAAAYRIVQEALTNALKYAGGAETSVVVRYSPAAVDLEVVDEGLVAAPAKGVGRGLTGMQERVAVFGGSIDAGPCVGGGYAVRAHLPVAG